MSLRRLILHLIIPLSKLLNRLHIAPSHRQCKARHYWEVKTLGKPGDVLLSAMRGELTNLFIPGKWNHAALYVGCGRVIEAVGGGVVEVDLIDFILSKDNVCLLRVTDEYQAASYGDVAVAIARKMVGKPYDFFFEPGDSSFYCSELIAFALNTASLNLATKPLNFEHRTTLGVPTVLPQDFYNAGSKFQKIFEV